MPSKLDTKVTPVFNRAANPPRADKPPQLNHTPPSPSPGGTTDTTSKPPTDAEKKAQAEAAAFKAKMLTREFNNNGRDSRSLTKKFNERSRDR